MNSRFCFRRAKCLQTRKREEADQNQLKAADGPHQRFVTKVTPSQQSPKPRTTYSPAGENPEWEDSAMVPGAGRLMIPRPDQASQNKKTQDYLPQGPKFFVSGKLIGGEADQNSVLMSGG